MIGQLSEKDNSISWFGDTQKEETVLTDVAVGKTYRIGKPSNRYFEHIQPFLEPSAMSVENLEDFKAIQGLAVRVVSILSMVGGNRIAILWKYDGPAFMKTANKVFANIDKRYSQ